MRFLLDTMVVSELRRPRPSAAVMAWFGNRSPDDLFLSVATIAELERGASAQQARNAPHANSLSEWIDRTLAVYEDRIVGVDTAIARRWGRLSGLLGYDNTDLLIAATALERGLTVATRDARGFERTGVDMIDPFADAG